MSSQQESSILLASYNQLKITIIRLLLLYFI